MQCIALNITSTNDLRFIQGSVRYKQLWHLYWFYLLTAINKYAFFKRM